MQLLLEDGDQHVGGYGAPDLRLDRVLAAAEKCLDAQMLLDPLEEQPHLPAVLVQRSDGPGRQRRIVGQEDQGLARAGILEADASQVPGIILGGVEAIERDGLIADEAGVAVGRHPVHALRIHVGLGARDEEGAGLLRPVQPREIQIAAIHDVERARLDRQEIEDIHLTHLAVGDVDESRSCATQIQRRVQPDRCLGVAQRRPVEQRQAQVNGGGVERVDGGIEIDVQRLADVQGPCARDPAHGQRVVDAPVAQIQRSGQRRARWRVLQPHVEQPAAIGLQTDLDIAQGRALGQMGKGQNARQVGTSQSTHAHIAPVGFDDAAKGLPRHELHDFRKQRLADVHASP